MCAEANGPSDVGARADLIERPPTGRAHPGGLPRCRFHRLRHAYATIMLGAGVDLAIVSKSLGRSNLGTTAHAYAHLTAGMAEQSAAKMDALTRG